MPRKEEKMSWTLIRMYAEKFEYTDQKGIRRISFNPPEGALDVKRLPFHIRYITSKGTVEEGEVECISVDVRKHQRTVRFIASGAIRRVRDYLICEIDGVKFLTH